MGIRSFLKRRKERRAKKRVVDVPTTSKVTQTTSGIVVTSGGGGGSPTPTPQTRGGGGGGGSPTPTPTQTQTQTPTPQQISKLSPQQISKLPQTQQIIQQQISRQQRIRRPIIPFIRQRRPKIKKKPFIDLSIEERPKGKVIELTIGRLNVASKKIDESQELLNKDIGKFNEQFGDKELEKDESQQAEVFSSNLEGRQKRIDSERKKIEEERAKRFPKVKKFIGKLKEKKVELQEERTKRVFERHDIPATPENLFLAKNLIKQKEDVASRDFELLLLGAMATPTAIVKGVPKVTKGKVTPTTITRIKLAIKKLVRLETKIKGDPTKPSLAKLRAIKKTRIRLKKFEKELLKSKKQIPLARKIVQLKPSKLKLKKILARRKRFRKITRVKETTKQIKKLEEERLKKILERRKKLAKFNKKLGIKKKIEKFKKVRLKKILERRKKLAKFNKKLGIKKKIEKFKKVRLKKILKARKRLAKFKGNKGVRDIFENIKRLEKESKIKQARIRIKKRTSKRAIRRIKSIPFQRIRLRGKVPKKIKKPSVIKIKPKSVKQITFKKIEPPTFLKGNVQQQLLRSPQEFKTRLIQAVKQMTPEQRANLNRLFKRARERKFNLNNELIKQGKNIKLSRIQKLSLKRGRENLQKLKNSNNNIKDSLKRIAVEEEKVSRRINTLQKSKSKQSLINKQKLKQKQLSKQRFKQRNNQKSIQKQLSKATQKSLSSLLALSLFGQAQTQKELLKTRLKQNQLEKQKQIGKQRQAQKQKIRFRFKQVQKQKSRQRIKQRKKRRIRIKLKKKLRLPKKKIKAQQLYNTFARPVKKRKGQSRPKLLKINKVPLTKIQAKRLGSTIVDGTLSRTFKIKKVGKAKPKKAKLKTRSFQKHKFRRHRIVKGKRKPLKNTFIEKKGRFLIDTIGEKRGLTLRRGLKQLEKRSGFKPQKRKSVKRITSRPIFKPTPTTKTKRQVMLKNLEKAREVRISNLRKKKK